MQLPESVVGGYGWRSTVVCLAAFRVSVCSVLTAFSVNMVQQYQIRMGTTRYALFGPGAHNQTAVRSGYEI